MATSLNKSAGLVWKQ